MKIAMRLAGCMAALLASAAAQEALAPPSSNSSDWASETGRYIVQFSAAGSSKFRKRDGSLSTDEFFNVLQSTDDTIAPIISFTSQLFHGASFDLANSSTISVADIQDLPEVERVWPASIFSLPVESNSTSGGNDFALWSPHNTTHVDTIHALGQKGKGVIIAIIDTGIDYNHPALGGGFGPGFKVAAGYDLVGENYTLGDAYNPDADPMDCVGHGTHVGGIVGSSDTILPGVAPEATLRAYKVFGCTGSTYEDVILQGFIRAYEDGADVITASLGSSRGFPDSPTAVLTTQIQAAGTFISIAAGNDGLNYGPFYTSNGGNSEGPTIVGSVEASEAIGYQVLAISSSGETRKFEYLSSDQEEWSLSGNTTGFFWPNARAVDSCGLSPYEPAPRDEVVLIQRSSECLSWQLLDSQLIGKANWVFIAQLENSSWELPDRIYYSDREATGFALITYEDGQWLFAQNEANNTITYVFTPGTARAIPGLSSLSGALNQFTSWGPTLDVRLKPEISAPGGHILSTYPISMGSWTILSGTSMATPYIAGVAALFFGSRGGRAALGTNGATIAHDRIIASGNPVNQYDGTGNKASVAHQGAGLVDAVKVVQYATQVSPVILNLNDTVHFSGTHSITVTNTGPTAITYTIYHESGVTAHTKSNGDEWVGLDPIYSQTDGNVATVEISAQNLTVAAGAKATFVVTFTEPAVINANILPVYGGAIVVLGDNFEQVRVTYMGVKGDIYASNAWAKGVPVLLSGYGGLMEEGHVYDMEVDTFAPYFNLLWSTRELSVDWVSPNFTLSDWQYPFIKGEKNWVGSVMMQPSGLYDTVVSFPLSNQLRFGGAIYATPQGFFANGTKIPDGDYKILLRTLRTFGDFHNPNDWETLLTPWFHVARKNVTSTTSSSTVAPTSTSTSTSSTVSATHTCDATPLIIVPQVRGVPRNLTLSQDFLAVDIPGATVAQQLTFALTREGYLRTHINGYTIDRFASALSTTQNNFIYIYPPGRISGNWKYLNCSIAANSTIGCTIDGSDKSIFQICGGEFIRLGSNVVSGCDVVQLAAKPNPDPFCNSASSSSSSPTLTSSTAQETTTSSSSSTRATTTAAKCAANNCARAVTGTLGNGSLRYPAAKTDCASYLAVTETVTASIMPKRTAAPVVEERQVAKVIPTYASACSAPNAYSSICNCWGIVAATTTVTVSIM